MAKSVKLTSFEWSVVRVALNEAIAKEESFQCTFPDKVTSADINFLDSLKIALDKIYRF